MEEGFEASERPVLSATRGSREHRAENRGGFSEQARWACAESERDASERSRRIPPALYFYK